MYSVYYLKTMFDYLFIADSRPAAVKIHVDSFEVQRGHLGPKSSSCTVFIIIKLCFDYLFVAQRHPSPLPNTAIVQYLGPSSKSSADKASCMVFIFSKLCLIKIPFHSWRPS